MTRFREFDEDERAQFFGDACQFVEVGFLVVVAQFKQQFGDVVGVDGDVAVLIIVADALFESFVQFRGRGTHDVSFYIDGIRLQVRSLKGS